MRVFLFLGIPVRIRNVWRQAKAGRCNPVEKAQPLSARVRQRARYSFKRMASPLLVPARINCLSATHAGRVASHKAEPLFAYKKNVYNTTA